MAVTAPSAAPVDARDTGPPLLSKPVVSWALYDLANTVFSMNIVSYFLSVWVIDVMGGTDTLWARANSVAMLMMLLTAPFLGAVSDRLGRRLPFLMVSTFLCVGLTALLGLPGLMGTIVLFVFANYFFQAGLIFYDSLLPVVSTPENRGRVSGLGVGLGYVGSFLGVGIGTFLLTRYDYVAVFRLTAVIFLLFSIPIFVFVKEPRRRARKHEGHILSGAFSQVARTVRDVRRYRGLGRFLIGRAFYTDAANTLIVFMGIYAIQNIGYSETLTPILMMVAIGAAVAGGLVWGPVVDRLGPKRTLELVLFGWMGTLLAASLIPLLGLPRVLFWGVACAAGICLGGTWSSDRPLMLVLSPPAKVGEFYGLYSMVGRFAAVIGPLLWAFVAETLGMGRPVAVLVLFFMVVAAWFILRRVDDTPRDWRPEELGGEEADPAPA
ncbi:MAG: MFS transporter [Gemmatimonadota bacterium]